MKKYNKQKEVFSTSTYSTVLSKTGTRDSTGSTKVTLVKNLEEIRRNTRKVLSFLRNIYCYKYQPKQDYTYC
jgi:hypothetical protein